jgi:hypothetical protein
MSNWILPSSKNKVITKVEDLPNHENLIGFVYKITHIKTGKFYIGKKSLEFHKRTAVTKKEKLETGTRRKTKIVSRESNWLNYYGSCKELTAEIKSTDKSLYKREILELCCTKKYLNYCELAYQIKADVLTANSYNGNILGRYFLRDMQNCKDANI